VNQKIEGDERGRLLIAAMWHSASGIGRVDSDEGRFARGFREGMSLLAFFTRYNLQKVVVEWATRGILMDDMSMGAIHLIGAWLRTEQEKCYPHDSDEHELLTGPKLNALKDDARRFLCECVEKNIECPFCKRLLEIKSQSEDVH